MEKVEAPYTVGGNVNSKLIQSMRRTVWRCPQKLQIELPYDPAVPLLGISREKHGLKGYIHPNIHCSTVYNSQNMETS